MPRTEPLTLQGNPIPPRSLPRISNARLRNRAPSWEVATAPRSVTENSRVHIAFYHGVLTWRVQSAPLSRHMIDADGMGLCFLKQSFGNADSIDKTIEP